MPDSLQFIAGGEIEPDADWHMSPHLHPFHELIVIMNGTMHLRIDGHRLSANPGDLLLYRAGEVHEETSEASAPVYTFFVAFRAPNQALGAIPLRTRDNEGRVRQMIHWIVHDYLARIKPARLNALLYAVLTELTRLNDSPRDEWLTRLLDYMQRNLANPVHLDDLARVADMSKFAFTRKFSRLSGHTPMQELRTMRLTQARSLILTSNLPMKQIAPMVGLNDEYHLSRLFRRQFGLNPSEMRRKPRP